MAKKRKKSAIRPTPNWMTTMGDMNNLLMCFFIVLMGDINVSVPQDFNLTISSFRGSLGIMGGGKSLSKGKLPEFGHNVMALPSTEKNKGLNRMMAEARELFKPEITARYVRIADEERGLIITLANDMFFEPGSAALNRDSFDILKKIAKLLSNVKNYIRIEGHTDNSPIGDPAKTGFSSNWELSGARAINVLRFLQEEGINPQLLSAVSFGEHRPITDNNTPETRSLNRRVDIVILKEKAIIKSTDKKVPRPLPDEEWE